MPQSLINVGDAQLPYDLHAPERCRGLVVFVHGSGSSRHSPRNRHVASALQRAGFATLLFDLLLEDEEADRRAVFDIDLLTGRLLKVLAWVHRTYPDLRVGLFGASTGAAAALMAAAAPESAVSAIVSRGGRPDLAGPALGVVGAPTLLIVGGADTAVLVLNRDAAAHMRCEHEVHIVPGATHLFEEPGTLDAVVDLARAWFERHLTDGDRPNVAGPTAGRAATSSRR